MPPPTLTRYQVATVVAALIAIAALAINNVVLLIATVAVYLVLIGLGVAIPQFRFFGPYICAGNAAKKCVALTFDDGPDPLTTPALLDLLNERDVQATFFCIGKNVDAHPALAKRIVSEGHLLGNHTYSHNNTTNFFTQAKLTQELVHTQKAIENATGISSVYFRPPVGLTNPRVFRAAYKLELKVIGWTIRSLDTTIRDPQRIVQRITARLRPGAIILLHDGRLPAERVLPTAKQLLDTLPTLGYEVVGLDRLIT